MHYTKFIIKNYKGIKELTIDLEKEPKSKVLTLVGLNESGKTSILEAVNLFQGDTIESESHKLIPKHKKSNFNDIISVEAFLRLNTNDEKLIAEFSKTLEFTSLDDLKEIAIEKRKGFKNSVFSKEDSGTYWTLSIKGYKKGERSKKTYSGNKADEWIKIVEYIENNLLPPIIYYPNFLFDFPSRIYLEKHPNESEEQETYREVISDILDSIGSGLNTNDHILERIKSNSEDAKEALESTISKMSSKVSETVFHAWQTLFQSKGKEIVLKPGVEQGNPIKYFLEVRLKEGSNHFQIAERSLGFKWFFTFLLFTEFRKMRSTDKGEILFLLDEPASNLHSTAQKKLLNTFEKLVSKCKLIYTTHSHHLINPDWLSGAYIVRNKNLDYDDEINFDSEKTDIEAIPYKQFASQHPEQKTYFQPILDALDYQPGLLEEIPNIVITEGKNDFYTLKYINEIILDTEFSDLNFYPGIGNDKNDQTIALYLGWNRNFKILLDGDKAGEASKKRYLSKFGDILKGKIITFLDVDTSLTCSMEYLFSEDERLNITRQFDPSATSYEKSKFNTAIQILFIQKKKIEMGSESIEKFKKVIATCK